MSYLKAFVTQIENFTKELMEMFPQDKEIKIAYHAISFISKANPRKIHEIFSSYSTPYKIFIINKDETLFTEVDENKLFINLDDNAIHYLKNNNEFHNIMNKVKTYWTVLDEESKNNIWLYLNIIYKLSDKATK